VTLFDYPVSYPFGATDPPYYSATHPHSGEDREAPSGTPIIVSGTQLGVVGMTGKASGPHTHIQKMVNNVFVNPAGGGGKVTGKVSEVGYNDEIGNYVRILDNNGVRWSYFHMRDKPLVKVGQVIEGELMLDDNGITNMWLMALRRKPVAADYDYWRGKPYNKLQDMLMNTQEYANVNAQIAKGEQAGSGATPLQPGIYKVG